ncbi:MAG TPA: anaerobic C4-dicarboxylate transporter family protein, partial [Haloferula sp.]
MDIKIILEILVILGALAMGARSGGVGLGLWGAVGLLVLVVVFQLPPGQIPGDVLLIVLTVIMAASAMEVAGGIDFLVRVAEKIIRKNPKHVTIVAPLVTYAFTFAAGTGHIVYPLLPVIFEVAHENGIRPERPMAVATIASQQAITASPVSAATAAMITILASKGYGLVQILLICVPSTLLAVLIAAIVQLRVGKELKDDPEYQRRLASGELQPPEKSTGVEPPPIKKGAKASALIFFSGVALVVMAGISKKLRTVSGVEIPMPNAIAIVMLTAAAVIMVVTKIPAAEVPKCKTCQSGVSAIIGILGLAWLGDTFMDANNDVIIGGLKSMATAAPWTFSIGLFVASMLLFSQAATAKTL